MRYSHPLPRLEPGEKRLEAFAFLGKPAKCSNRVATGLLTKIYELIATGELPTIRIGRAVRISVSTLQKWVDTREQQGVSV